MAENPKESAGSKGPSGSSSTHRYRGRSLRHTFFAKPRPMHLLMALLFLVFGQALVTQVRAQQTDPLESLSEAELVELLAELDDRADTLQLQRDELEAQLRQLNTEADQHASAQEAADKRKTQSEIASGVVPVEGPGVVLGITDGQSKVKATVFVTTLAEFRNAGAEAIEVGGVRLTPRSWFADSKDGSVIVDGETLSSPYTWQVIGDPETLSAGLEIRGGAASQLRSRYGATVTINRSDKVVIDSVAARFAPNWATVTEE